MSKDHYSNYNSQQLARMVHEIINSRLKEEMEELSDKYGIPPERIEKIAVSLYVQDMSKSQWKSSKAKFVKIYEKEVEQLFDTDQLDWRELGFLTFLSVKFTTYEDNALRNKDGSYCTQKDIIAVAKSTKPTVSKLMNDLIKKKIIFQRKHPTVLNGKCYFLSPYLFYRGKMIDTALKEKLKEMNEKVKEEMKKQKEIEDEVLDNIIEDGFDFDGENFIEMLEEKIVEECADEIVH